MKDIKDYIFSGLVLIIFLIPFCSGGINIISISIFEIITFTLVLLWGVNIIFCSEETLTIVKSPINFFFIVFLLFIIFQLIPLPPFLIKKLSFHTFQDKIYICDFNEYFANNICKDKWICIAYYWFDGFNNLLMILLYFSIFFLLIQLVQKKSQLNLIVYVIIISGLLEALIGKSPDFWWWANHIQSKTSNGKYITNEHFASYMIMIILLTIGLIITKLKNKSSKKTIKKIFTESISNQSNPEIIFLLFCSFVMGLRLLVSGSDKAIISLACGLFFFSIFIIAKNMKKVGFLIIFFSIFICFYSLLNSNDNNNNLSIDHEKHSSQISGFNILDDYPFFGVGYGSFSNIKKRYIEFHQNLNQENEFLQMFAIHGYIGSIIIITTILAFFYKILALYRKRKYLYSIGLCSGCMAGILGILFYSLYNCNFHISSNCIIFASILAICFISINIKRSNSQNTFLYRLVKIRLTPYTKYSSLFLFFLIWSILIYPACMNILAEKNCPMPKKNQLTKSVTKKNITKAISFNPNNSYYYYKMALYYMQKSSYNNKEKDDNISNAILYLYKSILLNPTHAMYWYDLGKQFSFLKKDSVIYISTYLKYADKCFKMAYKQEPDNSELLFEIGSYWVFRSKILTKENNIGKFENDNQKNQDIQDIIIDASNNAQGIKNFQQIFKKAIKLKPELWYRAVDIIWKQYPDDRIVLGIVPENNDEIRDLVLKRIVMKSG